MFSFHRGSSHPQGSAVWDAKKDFILFPPLVQSGWECDYASGNKKIKVETVLVLEAAPSSCPHSRRSILNWRCPSLNRRNCMEGVPSRDVPPHQRNHCGLMDRSFGVRKPGFVLSCCSSEVRYQVRKKKKLPLPLLFLWQKTVRDVLGYK